MSEKPKDANCDGDFVDKLHLLMEFAGNPDLKVADLWYTGDFGAAWQDVLAGCQGLLELVKTGENL